MNRRLYPPAVLLAFLALVLAALPATAPPTRAAPPIPVPVNVQASDCTFTDRVRISWIGSAPLYQVYRGSSPTEMDIALRQTSSSTLDDMGALPNTAYYYRVQAWHSAGGWSALSAADKGIRKGPVPSPPPDVRATDDGAYTGFVRVTWDDRSRSFDKYKVGRQPLHLWPPLVYWEAEESPYDDNTAVCTSHYNYGVKRRDLCGQWSDVSAPDEGYLRGFPESYPETLSASLCAYPDKVHIEWEQTGCTNYYALLRNTEPVYDSQGDWIYPIYENRYDDTDVDPGQVYHYWVGSCHDGGCWGNTTIVAPGTACPAPTGVQASDCAYADRVRITWNSVPNAEKYRVHRADSASGTKTVIGTVVSPDTSYDDTSGTASKTYHYWVEACFDTACTLLSGLSQADTGKTCCETPSTPSNLSASDGTYSEKVLVTWGAASAAAYYEVYRATTASGAKSKLGSPTGTWYDDTSADPGKVYHYWVKACNACDCGPLSATDDGFRAEEIELPVRSYVPLIVHSDG